MNIQTQRENVTKTGESLNRNTGRETKQGEKERNQNRNSE